MKAFFVLVFSLSLLVALLLALSTNCNNICLIWRRNDNVPGLLFHQTECTTSYDICLVQQQTSVKIGRLASLCIGRKRRRWGEWARKSSLKICWRQRLKLESFTLCALLIYQNWTWLKTLASAASTSCTTFHKAKVKCRHRHHCGLTFFPSASFVCQIWGNVCGKWQTTVIAKPNRERERARAHAVGNLFAYKLLQMPCKSKYHCTFWQNAPWLKRFSKLHFRQINSLPKIQFGIMNSRKFSLVAL